MKNRLHRITLGLLGSTALASCGVTQNQPPVSYSATHTIAARFIDSAVSGLHYDSLSFHGETDNKGQFQCNIGEEVKFSIGSLDFGKAICQRIVTPQTLAAEVVQVPQTTTSASGTVTSSGGSQVVTKVLSTSKPDAPEVINRVRLLMTMDIDPKTNGIQLPSQSEQTTVKISTIDFKNTAKFDGTLPPFKNIPELANRSWVAATDARMHFDQTIRNEIPNITSSPGNNDAAGGSTVNIGRYYDSNTGEFKESGLEKDHAEFDGKHEGAG